MDSNNSVPQNRYYNDAQKEKIRKEVLIRLNRSLDRPIIPGSPIWSTVCFVLDFCNGPKRWADVLIPFRGGEPKHPEILRETLRGWRIHRHVFENLEELADKDPVS